MRLREFKSKHIARLTLLADRVPPAERETVEELIEELVRLRTPLLGRLAFRLHVLRKGGLSGELAEAVEEMLRDIQRVGGR